MYIVYSLIRHIYLMFIKLHISTKYLYFAFFCFSMNIKINLTSNCFSNFFAQQNHFCIHRKAAVEVEQRSREEDESE